MHIGGRKSQHCRQRRVSHFRQYYSQRIHLVIQNLLYTVYKVKSNSSDTAAGNLWQAIVIQITVLVASISLVEMKFSEITEWTINMHAMCTNDRPARQSGTRGSFYCRVRTRSRKRARDQLSELGTSLQRFQVRVVN